MTRVARCAWAILLCLAAALFARSAAAADCPASDGGALIYTVRSGDYDGDGLADVFLDPTAYSQSVELPYGIDLDVNRKSHSSPLVLRALPGGGFSLIASPSAAQLAAVVWSPGVHNLRIGDFDGDGTRDAMLQAQASGGTSAVVLGIGPGAVSLLNQTIGGTQLGAPIAAADGKSVCGQDLNGDGRDDLLVEQAGSGDQVSYADKTGTLGPLVPYPPCTVDGAKDSDCDGIDDRHDAFPFNPAQSVDTDGDGQPDPLDIDKDGDGIPDPSDALPLDRNNGVAVGALPATFAVSPTGKARYRVPIRVAPGAGGMVPKLAIAYDGESGNDLLGMGFFIEGLSQITRCPTTIAQDGYINGVNFDKSDRFCLDGQRLVAVNGEYGADSTEYRTEIETHARIVSYGSVDGGPASFRVWRAEGGIDEYGFTSDSQRETQGRAAILSWAIDKSSDRSGNYQTYTYAEDNAAGSHYLTRIDYTGNDAAGLAPANSLRFDYEARNDVLPSHARSTVSAIPVRLTRIESYVGSTQIGHYDLAYSTTSPPAPDYDGVGGRSRLKSVTECVSDVGCLPPTTFAWDPVAPAPALTNIATDSDTQYPGGAFYADQEYLLGDVNGDGKADLVWTYLNGTQIGYALYLAKPTGDGFTFASQHQDPGFNVSTNVPSANRKFLLMDVNGDGRRDLVWAAFFGNSLYRVIYLANDTGTDFVSQGYEVDADSNNYVLPDLNNFLSADVNGDGRSDLVWTFRQQNRIGRVVYLATTGANGKPALGRVSAAFDSDLTPAYYDNQFFVAGDVNGDHKDDLVWTYTFQNKLVRVLYLANPSGDGFFKISLGVDTDVFPFDSLYRDQTMQLGDVNGDGKADLVWSYNHDNQLGRVLYLSSQLGTSFTRVFDALDPASARHPNDYTFARTRLADMNGDGKTDLVYNFNDTVGLNFGYVIFLANGDGRGFTESTSGTAPTDSTFENHFYDYADVNGDGTADLVWAYNTSGNELRRTVFVQPAAYPDHVQAIVDGLGKTTSLAFEYLASSASYVKGMGTAYPDRDDIGLGYVISHVGVSDGIGGVHGFDYAYAAARTNLWGRGYLGFAARTVTDDLSGIATTERYRQDFPLVGQTESSVVETGAGSPIAETFRHLRYTSLGQPAGTATFFPFVQDEVALSYELTDGGLTSARVSENTYDADAGTLTQSVVTTGPDFTGAIDEAFDSGGTFAGADVVDYQQIATTTNLYLNDFGANWRLGFLQQQTTAFQVPDPAEPVRTVVNTWSPYDSSSFLVGSRTEFAGSLVSKSHSFQRDAYGNPTQDTVTADDIDGTSITPQTTTFGPYLAGVFPQQVTNALSQSETRIYDARLGEVTRRTDANGLVSDRVFNGLGQLVAAIAPDGTLTHQLYDYCAPTTCPPLARYKVTAITTNGSAPEVEGAPRTTAYFDILGREVRSEQTALDGRTIRVDTSYDARGRVGAQSAPYFEGDAVLSSTLQYDDLDRPKLRLDPDGGSLAHTYESDPVYSTRVTTTQTIFNPLDGSTRTTTAIRQRNALGQLVAVSDALGTTTYTSYDAQGHPSHTTVGTNSATTVTSTFDVAGNRTHLVDPDAGEIVSKYDGLGRLRQGIHAPDTGSMTVTTTTYDTLNRIQTREDILGEVSETSQWTYDPANGKGKLATASTPGKETRVYSYDALARLQQVDTTLTGLQPTQSILYGYDAFSREALLTYPSGFRVETLYNALGYRAQLRNRDTREVFWSAEQTDARGQLTRESFGNGLVTTRVTDPATGLVQTVHTGTGAAPSAAQSLDYRFDSAGNLLLRSTSRAGETALTESFGYDELNRLKTASTTAPVSRSLSFDYDALGNLKTKSGFSDPQGYQYGANGAGIHAVTSVTLGTTTRQYGYDSRGNMTAAGDRTITYSAANLPTSVSTPDTAVEFRYGADRDRYYQRSEQSGTVTETFYYGDGLFEIVREGAVTRQKAYVAGLFVHTTVRLDGSASATTDVSYLHRDHLGSTDAITDRAGGLRERDAFAPFGERRADDWSDASPSFLAGVHARTLRTTTQGFTGHEEVDAVGLVHMGGRVYDPALGRFLTPDPLVSYPEFSQSYNRYSYVLNNPLGFTDPTGLGPDAVGDDLFEPGCGSGGCVSRDPGGLSGLLSTSSSRSSSTSTNASDRETALPIDNGSIGPLGPPGDFSNYWGEWGGTHNYLRAFGDYQESELEKTLDKRPEGFLAQIGQSYIVKAQAESLASTRAVQGMFPANNYEAIAQLALAVMGAAGRLEVAGDEAVAEVIAARGITGLATKAAAREAAAGLGLPEAQARAVQSAIGRATTSSTVDIVQDEGGNVLVRVVRPGANGYQAIESTVTQDGVKTVVQKAYDAAGRLVHFDPKTP